MFGCGRPRRVRHRSGSPAHGRIPAEEHRIGRSPSGIRTASGCRASRRLPAARWRRRASTVLSESAKVTVPPSPPLSVLAMMKRSMCSGPPTPASSQTSSMASSIAGGPQAQVGRSFQSGTRRRAPSRTRTCPCHRQVQTKLVVRLVPDPNHAVRRGRSRPPHWARSGCARRRAVGPRCCMERSIAMTGVIPLPAVTKSNFCRRRVGQCEVPLRGGEANDRSGLQHR